MIKRETFSSGRRSIYEVTLEPTYTQSINLQLPPSTSTLFSRPYITKESTDTNTLNGTTRRIAPVFYSFIPLRVAAKVRREGVERVSRWFDVGIEQFKLSNSSKLTTAYQPTNLPIHTSRATSQARLQSILARLSLPVLPVNLLVRLFQSSQAAAKPLDKSSTF